MELQVQVLGDDARVLTSLVYPFSVRAPWWRSPWSWALYGLLVIGVCAYVLAIIRMRQRVREQALIGKQLQQELDRASNDLSASTMDLLHRNEQLRRVREALTEQKLRLGKDYPDKDYRQVCALIDGALQTDAQWGQFEIHFDRVHNGFFKTLRERFPQLTENDLRFCAYLRLNVSNKDIAALMNISLRGVEAARGRIRKKIGLSPSDSLEAFMIGL